MPGTGKAFVTLLTSPSYLPGVLVLLHSLLSLHPAPRDFQIVCLVTPETVDAKTIGELRNAGFDLVVGVEPIGSGKAGQEGLSLMGRPDLNLALTKLHIFRLSPLFHTIIYLDADVLPIRPLAHLFDTTAPHPLSASPDTGWPDCFNSGVLVVRPRESDWQGLRTLLKNGEDETGIYSANKDEGGNGSFDGADQGLLNEWFSSEGGGGDWNRLSFTYNVTPSAAYQYAPAYKRYASKINAVHFIGKSKPWSNLLYRPAGISKVKGKEDVFDYPTLIDRWYAVYDAHVRPTAAHNPDISRRFTVPENQAIWNTSSTGAPQQPVDRLDLDALKAATNLGVLSLTKGQYTSLPLDGRVDLIMPKPKPRPVRSVRFTEQGREGLPPAQHEVQGSAWEAQKHGQRQKQGQDQRSEASSEDTIVAPIPTHQQKQHHQAESAPAPAASPPRPEIWDAQRYSPPKDSKPEMGNSTIEFYQNAWDAPAAQQSNYYNQPSHDHHQHGRHGQHGHRAEHKREPEYPTLPDNVVKDTWYQQFTSSVPDRSAVQPVFPWEGKTRQPTRVFPRGSTPPPVHAKPDVAPILSVQNPTPPLSSPPPRQATPPPAPAQPPKSMAEAMASYTNAWDHDDSIKRYMSRLTGVPLPRKDSKGMYDQGLRSGPPTPGPGSTAQLRRLDSTGSHVSHDTRSSASGDGDDEDEGESEEGGNGNPLEPRSPRVSMRRYKEKQREQEKDQGQRTSGPNPRYRDKHAQTDRREMQDVGLQVNDPANSPTARTFASAGAGGSGGTRDLSAQVKRRDSASANAKPSSGSDTPTGSAPYASVRSGSGSTAVPIPSTANPPGPRRVPFPVSQPSTDRVPQRRTAGTSATGLSGTTSFSAQPSNMGQMSSSPTSVVSNLPTGLPPRSSIDSMRSSTSASPSLSPPLATAALGSGSGPSVLTRRRESQGQDITPSAVNAAGIPSTRASRHFDPSTDIGVRKRETQEVLQRLMRGTGSGNGNGH